MGKCFATLLKSHPHAETSHKIISLSGEHALQGEDLCETSSSCQNIFKRLEL